jgi:hypothetical protein
MLEALEDDSSKLTSSGERIAVEYLREKLENIERNKTEKTGTGPGSGSGTGTGDSRKRQEGPADLNIDNMNKKKSKISDRISTSQSDPLHFSAPSSFNCQGLSIEAPRVRSNPAELRNSQQQVEPAHNQNQNQNQNQNNSNYAYTGSDSRSQSTARTLTSNTSSSSDTYDVGNYSCVDSEKSNHSQRAKNRNFIFT